MVIVGNEFGIQLAEYQGSYDTVKDKILKDAPDSALFYHAIWGGPITKVEKKEW